MERRGKVKNWLADNGVATVMLTALTILVGIAISEVQNRIGWLKLSVAILLMAGFYWSTLYLVSRPMSNTLHKLGQDIEAQLRKNKIEWLYDTGQLAQFELNVDTTEIWLITSDLMDDSLEGPFNGIVRSNLKRKIEHTYFFPHTPENHARFGALLQSHRGSRLIKHVYLPDNFFMLVPKLDIVIYNPRGVGNRERRGFMGIPARNADSHYHAEVSTDLLDKLVGSLLDSEFKTAKPPAAVLGQKKVAT